VTGPARKKLGDLLVEAGVISRQDLDQVLASKGVAGQRLGERLVEEGLCTELHIASALSSQMGLERIDLQNSSIEPEAVSLVPEEVARRHLVMPISVDGNVLTLAVADPLNLQAMDDVQFASSKELAICIATPGDVTWAIDKHYRLEASMEEVTPSGAAATIEVLRDPGGDDETVETLKARSQAIPIVRMVNQMLGAAVKSRATELHLEPSRHNLNVRLRVDGQVRPQLQLPKWVQGAVTSRVKVMARMDLEEKKRPQERRLSARIGGVATDLWVSTLPTRHGEKILITLGGARLAPQTLDRVGLEKSEVRTITEHLTRPRGMIVVAGPAGSGRTTTLYAALQQAALATKNVVTVENPVQRELEGVNQVSIDEKSGRGYPEVLEGVLRQDPDILLIGELDDPRTARMAMQASLAGRLVLTTCHAPNAPQAITRLRDLCLSDNMISAGVAMIVAQRLVRAICPHCRTAETMSDETVARLGFTGMVPKDLKLYRGAGCDKCKGKGFVGRTGLFELMVLTPRIRQLVANGAPGETIRSLALAEGMRTLGEVAMERATKGLIDVGGLLRVVAAEETAPVPCGSCGQTLSADFLACPHCGAKRIETCDACKAVIDPDWGFCPYCATAREAKQDLRRAS